MHPDNEAPLTLSKWPFYLGDILLVAIALAIAILDNWQLSDMQVISCVVAVALGAAIFVLPYVVEYYMRVSEKADDRFSENRLLRSHLRKADAAFLECYKRLEALELSAGAESERYELLASVVDHKLDTGAESLTKVVEQVSDFERVQSEQVEALAGMKLQLDERIAVTPEVSISSEEYSALQAELAAVQARLKALEKATKVSVVSGAEAIQPQEPCLARAPRRRRQMTDSGLLQRAIKEKQDSSSSAVNRIIESKNKRVVSDPKTLQPVVEKVPEEAEAQDSIVELDAAEKSIETEASPENIETASEVDIVEDVESVEKEVSNADAISTVKANKDLFGETIPPATRRAPKKMSDTVFTVSILIGIGNKPLIRGSGGGLNWKSGVPMEFEEIGKWRWVAPADLDHPIELQVYRNDEDADRKGPYTLEPGQKLEVSPVF